MAYAIAYCIHTLEMNVLRGWGVAFLGFVAANTGASDAVLSPTTVLCFQHLNTFKKRFQPFPVRIERSGT